MVRVAVAGAINWDINLFVDRFAKVGEEVAVRRITRVPGGKAANVAVAASRVLGPNQVGLIGCLGEDAIAARQMEILKDEGVDTSAVMIVEGEESGQAYIIIDEQGRNVINTHFGANMMLSPKALLATNCLNIIKRSPILTVIDPPIDTIKAITEMGRRHQKMMVWDAGVRAALGLRALEDIVRNIDYIILNEVELSNLTKRKEPMDAREALSQINEGIKLVVKLGARGCVMVTEGDVIEASGIDLKRLGMAVVNTVGCGDAFLGVFLASKAEGLSDREALMRANVAGASKATRPETRGSPTRAELERWLERLGM
ncbi:MAG: carbohydrate kinase family protein [Candidatus Bathyarchaeia archaeon]